MVDRVTVFWSSDYRLPLWVIYFIGTPSKRSVLEGVLLSPGLAAVLVTEEGLRLGPRPTGKEGRAQWLSSPTSQPRSREKGILFHTSIAHLS